ncbi:hypothetical protein PsorP6_015173 [Peronosclerospora sorghi]|uniref:Uncharacterized protein n=1 Tax=Peronosclerospora sorghi TaxID=230839 RepID=A0ACC0VRK8_9STRA|nr:hypothetical protein PsorP6_015173 [Peronosclerospora sorghi]
MTEATQPESDREPRVERATSSDAEEDAKSEEKSEPPLSTSEEEDTEDDVPHDAVGFGDAMSKVLSQHVAEDAQPILAKRTTARMREIQSDKKESKTARVSAADKRARELKNMAVPDHTTAAQDRQLRIIATKGVVALFNAIHKHQHQNGKKDDKNDKKVKEMSKDHFLGLLKASQQKVTDKGATNTSWAVVQDNYMMSAKLKDWDNQHGTEVGRVQEQGDAEVEATEDVAWKPMEDALDSDKEAAGKNNRKHKRLPSARVQKSLKKTKRS